jgi:tetrapyrrole methylase family protein/MazG family protein
MDQITTAEAFERLLEIMRALRAPKGCVWDRQQTHESLKPYVVEEAYEVVAAIESNDTDHFREELGDLLLQIVFHAQIAEEHADFGMKEILQGLSDKLVRRHPHVFGNASGYSYGQWEQIKAQEKGDHAVSRIGKINHALPALSMARRIQENAAAVGFDWDHTEPVMEKVDEELHETKKAMEEDDPEHLEEEIGDLLFAIVNLCRFLHVDPENALRKASQKFMRRFALMESMLQTDGLVMEDQTLETLDLYWEKAKRCGLSNQ